jgi:hypothetical protein
MNLPLELGIGNGARPHNYSIAINMPAELGPSFVTNKWFESLILTTDFPGAKMNTRSVFIDGHEIKIPGTMQQDQTWKATFYLDDNYYARIKMESWMYLLDNYFLHKAPPSAGFADAGSMAINKVTDMIKNFFKPKSSGGIVSSILESGSSFIDKVLANEGFGQAVKLMAGQVRKASITVTQKSYTGTDILSCTMYNAFPIDISSITFDDSDVSSISQFTVTFAYSHHEIHKGSGLGDMLGSKLSSMF